ncbi:MAG TPA: SRPBCC domain-containing protein [Acidimicrobiales bacterium]|nr:SRPBCC domain-containing protein [Acidimicrobiales bacterium]
MPEGRAAGELRYTRVVEAPRELVFGCMIDPDHLAQFWGPRGTSAPRQHIVVDARPGGVFETLMVNDADGSSYPTRAVYDEVRPPELLAWTESHSGMKVRTRFVALGPQRTEVRIHQRFVPEAFLGPEARAGFSTSLDRFAAYAAELAGRDARP